jgi:type I restriction enzyme, S subunit
MTILELFKKVNPSVLAAKMIFKHLQSLYPVLKISDIADTSSGGTPNRGMIDYYNGDIPWVKSGELKDDLITTCDEFITEAGLKNSSAKLFPKGTLLVAMYGANIGKTGVLDFDATTNQAVCAIFPKVNISNEYLFWYFKQQRIDFIAVGKGGAQPNISQTIINNASIVVPDEKIQKKIVDFLDKIEQENTIDESFFIPDVLKDVEQICNYKDYYVTLTNSFDNQLTLIENLNQAILQEAVQGKLVQQDPTDEPASQLLERIKAEKAKIGKKDKLLPPIKPEEIPFEIPENWVWCRLEWISEVGTGATPLTSNIEYYQGGNIPWITSGATSELFIDKAETYITDKALKETNCKVYPKGTLVIAMYGQGKTRGQITELNIEAATNQACATIVFYKDDFVLRKYVKLFFRKIYEEIRELAQGGAQPNLNLGKIKETLIPLPPLSEQQRIVAEIEKQLSKTKELKAHMIANQQATEQLLKALLHGAFTVN